MTPTTAVLLLRLTQGLVIETDSPDAHCPDLHQTRAAVNARLGTIQSEGFRARYTIVRVRGDTPRDFVLLELAGPDGDVRLRRELPIGNSCAAVSEAIALVLDEYFRALVNPEEETPELEPAAEPARSPEKDTPVKEPANPRASAPVFRVALELAAISYSSSAGLGVRLERLLGPSWHAGLELLVPLGARTEALPLGAEARARSFELNAHLGFGLDLGAVRPYAAPVLFTSIERASTSAPLASTTGYRWLGGAGLELGVNFELSETWQSRVFVSGGRVLVQSADFVVQNEEVLASVGWTGRLGLGLSLSF